MRRLVILVLTVLLSGTLGLSGWAGDPRQSPQPEEVEHVRQLQNSSPSFVVRVDVDHPDRVYRGGQQMTVSVVSEKAGYLYLLYTDAKGKLSCLFPNRFQRESRIPAGQKIVIPAPQSRFRLRVGPPYGREVLKAVVTLQPLTAQDLGVPTLTEGDLTPLPPQQTKGVLVELARRPDGWAEHQVEVFTGPAEKPAEPCPPGRIALLVGLSRYEDPAIPQTKVGARDAQEMDRLLKDRCGFQKTVLLLDEKATLEAIRQAMRKTLPEQSRPGDLVVIFWSGHGGRCADQNGDEKDGLDEYLVPYDGRLSNLNQIRSKMLLDDEFGRLIQELDGRRLLLVLDTCHAAGQSAYEKGVGQPGSAESTELFDFLDGELGRLKDVGQREMALLAAARANQVAFVRREGDLSVMTYFLQERLASGSEPLDLKTIFQHLQIHVPRYVQDRFPGATQEPFLVDQTTDNLYLRP